MLQGVPKLEVKPPSSLLQLSGLLQPGSQETLKCKITWDWVLQGLTCTQELDSTTAVGVPILLGDICPAGSPAFKGSTRYRGEAIIFAPVTKQMGAAGNAENTQV